MKNLQIVLVPLMTVALMPPALVAQNVAQNKDQSNSPAIAAAHCQYTPDDAACAGAAVGSSDQPVSSQPVLVAQMPRGVPRPPIRPRPSRGPMAYPRPAYPVWDARVAGRHAIIGAVIGFALGAAAGGRENTKTAFAVGGITGGIGALIGMAMPAIPSRYDRWRYDRWPDEDDDAFNRAPSKLNRGRKSSTRQVAVSTPVPAVLEAEKSPETAPSSR